MANPSSADRRQAAREKARRIAEQQAKREKTAKAILYGGITVVVIAVLAVVGALVWQSSRPVAGPSDYVSGSVSFAKDGDGIGVFQPTTVPDGADVPEGLRPVSESDAKEGAATVKVYLDFQCPGCQSFEVLNGEMLKKLAAEGSIVLEYEPVAILDRASGGNKYSTRSANLAACVADSDQGTLLPDLFVALFENQPQEGTSGMEDDQMLSIAESAGIDLDAELIGSGDDAPTGTVRSCAEDVAFEKSVERTTQDALNDEGISGTPTVLIDGELYEGDWSDGQAFAVDILRASGEVASN